MSRVLAWIRKSKGTDDDIGLKEQREHVHSLADDLADEKDVLDLGIQTGFSTMGRDSDAEQLLDERDDVQETVQQLQSGKYDYLVAFDANRICRDDYFSVIEYATTSGSCEMVYVEDVADDDLTHDIRRRIDRETKQQEIRKSKRAVERRQEDGLWQGRPPFGFTFDRDGRYLVPTEAFEAAREVILLREQHGLTYEEIADRTGVGTSTAWRIVNDRRELYDEPADHPAIRADGPAV